MSRKNVNTQGDCVNLYNKQAGKKWHHGKYKVSGTSNKIPVNESVIKDIQYKFIKQIGGRVA